MFTGIVEETGEVIGRTETADGLRLRFAVEDFDSLRHGQSISISGVCLTVEDYDEVDAEWFEVFLAAETVEKTYLGDLAVGDACNVERAMPAEGRFDGHLVQGHVDTVTTVTDIESVGEDWYFEFEVPAGYGQYIVSKGSVTLDGISLTVADILTNGASSSPAEATTDRFTVAIIPATYELTTLSEKQPGDPVHLEVDVIAKYVERMVDGYP